MTALAGRPSRAAVRELGIGGLALVVGTAVATAAYWPSLHTWFVGDDFEEIYGAIHSGPLATTDLHPGRNFRPVNQAMLELSYRWHGLDPTGYHVVGLALHVLASLLVVVAARELLPTRAPRSAPFLAGAVFLVMPNHIEPVAWISSRGDLTMACCILLVVVCWVRGTDDHRAHPTLWRLGASVAFAVALATKEPSIAVPLVISALEVARRHRTAEGSRWSPALRAAARPWELYLIVAGYLVARRLALGTVKSGSLRAEFVGDSVTGFAKHALTMIVRTWVPALPTAGWIAVAAMAVATAVALAILAGRAAATPGRPSIPWQAAFLISAPVLLAIPAARLGVAASGPGGERLVYTASAFAAMLIGWGLSTVHRRHATGGVVLVAVALTVSGVWVNVGAQAWDRAGDLTESSVEQMGANWPRNEQVYLIAAPENLDDAIALRNAVGHALVLTQGWTNPAPVDELSNFGATSERDEVLVVPTTDARRWRVRLTSPGAEFIAAATRGVPPSWGVEGVLVTIIDDREIEVAFDPTIDLDRVWYLSEGRLRRLPAPAG